MRPASLSSCACPPATKNTGAGDPTPKKFSTCQRLFSPFKHPRHNATHIELELSFRMFHRQNIVHDRGSKRMRENRYRTAATPALISRSSRHHNARWATCSPNPNTPVAWMFLHKRLEACIQLLRHVTPYCWTIFGAGVVKNIHRCRLAEISQVAIPFRSYGT